MTSTNDTKSSQPQSLPSDEIRFKTSTLGLISLTKEVVLSCQKKDENRVSPDIVDAIYAMVNATEATAIINNYIKYSFQFWEEMRVENRKFFEKNAGAIFGDLPLQDLNIFQFLFESKNIKKEDEEDVWRYFHSLCKISIKYIHNSRGPHVKIIDGKERAAYKNENFKSINIIDVATKWGIKLVFK